MGKMHIVRIEEKVREVHHTHTYRFRAPFSGGPGQFVMVWIPRYDELPMALSHLGERKGVTVHAYGNGSTALAEKFEVGDRIGVRGPYGNTFRLEGERVLCVAGGTGMASIVAAIEALAQAGTKVVTALGAKTAEEILFEDRAAACGEVHVATDDGSRGFHGFVPALADRLLDSDAFDHVLTCGPELMMKAVVDSARSRDTPVQASLERYMKCGVGICDACVLDDKLVCLDGPVFTGEQLARSEDFGRWRRDASGIRVKI